MATISDWLISQPQDSWRADAACRGADTDVFFIGPGHKPDAAIAVCDRCEVRDECLEYALDNDEEFGIWGGLMPKQRKELRRLWKEDEPHFVDTPESEAGTTPLDPVALLPAAQPRPLV